MKASSLALCATGLLTALVAHAQTPYVETTTLTFYWGFASGYQTNAAGQAPTLPDVSTFDPETLPNGWQSYTDTLRTQPYTGPVSGTFRPAGGNEQIIEMLLQRAIRDSTPPPLLPDELPLRDPMNAMFKEALGYRWQIIAVREAPRNVRELATNPYRIFLAGQAGISSLATSIIAPEYGPESADDDPIPADYLDNDPETEGVTVDTGITITLGGFSGTYNESKWNAAEDKVSKATGKVSTAFTVNFGALFYEDPLHAQDRPNRVTYNFHLRRNYWQASASGLINYNIRSTAAPLPTFIATGSGATGTGWFRHERDETEYVNGGPRVSPDRLKTYGASGIAPLKVVMSSIQYQKRDRFAALLAPSTPLALTAVAFSGTQVDLTWFDRSTNEEGFEIQRRVGVDGVWEPLTTIPNNDRTPSDPVAPQSFFGDELYRDSTALPGTTYFYRVRATNAGNGPSGFTNIANVTTPVPAPPAP